MFNKFKWPSVEFYLEDEMLLMAPKCFFGIWHQNINFSHLLSTFDYTFYWCFMVLTSLYLMAAASTDSNYREKGLFHISKKVCFQMTDLGCSSVVGVNGLTSQTTQEINNCCCHWVFELIQQSWVLSWRWNVANGAKWSFFGIWH